MGSSWPKQNKLSGILVAFTSHYALLGHFLCLAGFCLFISMSIFVEVVCMCVPCVLRGGGTREQTVWVGYGEDLGGTGGKHVQNTLYFFQ